MISQCNGCDAIHLALTLRAIWLSARSL